MGSFQYKTEENFPFASCIDHLKPDRPNGDKFGCETWSCAFSPDESYFAWSCGKRIVTIVPWNRCKSTLTFVDNKDAEGNTCSKQPVTIDCGYLVWSLAFGSGTSEANISKRRLDYWTRFDFTKDLILATGLSNGRIRIWNVSTGKLYIELMDHKDVVRHLAFAPDGSLRLVSASRDTTLKVWDLQDDGNMFKTFHNDKKSVYCCAWSPNSKLLASVGSGKSVMLWNMITYKLLSKLEGHSHEVVSCEFSSDSALLATASYDTRIFLWDPYTGKVLRQYGHLFPPPRPIFASGANDKWVRSVSFSHDGRHLASVADDGYLRFWCIFNEDDPEEIASVEDPLCCTYSPSGNVLAVGDRNGSVSFWRSPMKVESLQHLCRQVIRHLTETQSVDKLLLPLRIKEYLKYKDCY